MSFTPGTGAVISLGVDGAAASRRDIDSVGDSLGRLNNNNFKNLSGQIGDLQGQFTSLQTTIADVIQFTIAGLGAGAFVGLIKGSIDALDNLKDLSTTSGIAVEQLAGLSLAAQKSGGDLEGIASSINKLSVNMGKDAERFRALGVTAKDPLEAFKQLSDVFSAIDDPQTRARLGADALGKSWESAAPLMSEGGKRIGEMVDKGTKLSAVTKEMTEQADEFNDKMAEMQTAVTATKLKLAGEMLPALTQIATAITQALNESGKLAAAWVALGALGAFAFTNEFSSAAVKIKDLRTELEGLETDLSLSKNAPAIGFVGRMLWGNTTSVLEGKVAAARAEIISLQNEIARPEKEAIARAVAAKAEKEKAEKEARAAKEKADAFFASEDLRKKREAAAKKSAEEYTASVKSAEDYIASLKGEAAQIGATSDQIKMMTAARAAEKAPTAALRMEIMSEALALDFAAKAWAEKAEAEKAAAAIQKRFDDGTAGIVDQIGALQDQIDTYGLLGSAVVELQKTKVQAQLQSWDLSQKEQDALDLQLAGLTVLASKKRELEGMAAAKSSMSDLASEAKRMADSMESAITDALMRGFESGKSFGKNLIDTLKNMFATLILRPTIQGILAPVTGGIAASILPGAASASTSGVGSAVGAGLGISGTVGAIGAGAMQTAGALFSGQIALGQTLTSGMAALTSGTMSGFAAGASSIVGALGPIALGIAAAVAIWKKLDTSGTYHTGGASSASAAGVETIRAESLGFAATRTNADTEKMTAGLVSGIVSILDSTATAFGKTAGYTAATAFADDTSKDGAWGALVISKLGEKIVDWSDTRSSRWAPKEFGDGDVGSVQYLAALSGSVRTALDDIGLPSWAKTMLDGIGAAPSIETLAKVVDQINATQSALAVMGSSLTGFANMSGAAVSALIAASGGIESLAGSASAYYDAFYLESEKTSGATKQVTDALASVGLAMPATKAAFRAQVEAQMALGEAGAPTVAALLKASGAFAQLHPEIEAAANAARSAADILSERNDLQKQYDDLTMTSAQLREKERLTIDASNLALYDRLNALNGEATAIAAIKASAATLIGGADAAFSVLQNVINREKVTKSAAHDLEMKAIQIEIDAKTASVAESRALSDALHAALDIRIAGQDASDRLSAQVQIKTALAIAQAGGTLPAADSLKNALGTLGKDSSALFSTYQDYQRDFYSTQNDIASLGNLSDKSLSVEQKTLDALNGQKDAANAAYAAEIKSLDDIVTGAQLQLDEMKGQSTTLLSINQALQGFGASLLAAKANPIVSATGAINNAYQTALGRAPEAGGMAFYQNLAAGGTSVTDIVNAITNSPEAQVQSLYSSVLGRLGEASGVDFWMQALSNGVSVDSARAAMMQSDEYKRLHPFAVGTNFIPQDMPAMVHVGERIIPAADNRELMNRLRDPGANNAVLSAAVDRLTAIVEKQQAALNRIAESTGKHAEMFESSTAGGGAMIVEVTNKVKTVAS